jgi:hypothetical protein
MIIDYPAFDFLIFSGMSSKTAEGAEKNNISVLSVSSVV